MQIFVISFGNQKTHQNQERLCCGGLFSVFAVTQKSQDSWFLFGLHHEDKETFSLLCVRMLTNQPKPSPTLSPRAFISELCKLGRAEADMWSDSEGSEGSCGCMLCCQALDSRGHLYLRPQEACVSYLVLLDLWL